MVEPKRTDEHAIREAAYFIWRRAGQPEGRSQDHWLRAVAEDFPACNHGPDHELMDDEEKLLADRPDVDIPALLTKDVLGG